MAREVRVGEQLQSMTETLASAVTYERIAVVYLAATAIVSVVTFGAYGIDKRRAVKAQRRIPERTLHLLALACGWPGAWIGQRVFRHKTQKTGFRVVFFLGVGAHAALLAVLLYLWRR